MQDEISEALVISSDAVYAGDKALADSQVTTARAYPRNMTRAVNNAIATVTLDQQTAESCTYSVPRGGKTISGPSIVMAKVLAQFWGNLRVEAKVVNIDATHVTCQAVCWDLETNMAWKAEVKRSILQNETKWNPTSKKMERTGKSVRMNDDMITVTGNAGNSIAARNAVLAVIPKAYVDKVYNAALGAITGDISDATKLMQRVKGAVQRFKDMYGVEEKELLMVLEKNSLDLLNGDDLITLVGLDTALKNGDTTVEMAFSRAKPGAGNAGSSSNSQKERQRFRDAITNSTTVVALSALEPKLKSDFPDLQGDYDKRLNELLDQQAANN